MWGEVKWWEVMRGEVMWGEVMWGEVMWGEVMRGEVMWGEVMWGEVMWGEVMWNLKVNLLEYQYISSFASTYSQTSFSVIKEAVNLDVRLKGLSEFVFLCMDSRWGYWHCSLEECAGTLP